MKKLHSQLRRLEAEANPKETGPTKIVIRYVPRGEDLSPAGTQRVVVEYSGPQPTVERGDA
jgi:FKBP-type peptidyl-prolyl cis-trans isomerase